ncbi:MAG: hypothetical protein ACRCX4_14720 [Bacteroidales bacterium]
MQQSQDGKSGINKEMLLDFLKNPYSRKITISDLELLISEYPAFTLARLALLKRMQTEHDIRFASFIQASVPLLSDRDQLFCFLADHHLGWNEIYELQKQKHRISVDEKPMSTSDALSLIDSFLNKESKPSLPAEKAATEPVSEKEIKAEDLELEKEVQASYAALNYVNELLSENNEKEQAEIPLEHQDLIDRFISFSDSEDNFRSSISSVKQDSEFMDDYPEEDTDCETQVTVQEPSEDDLLTESLAKIYIKQKRYEKALEIIKSLSLKYPKKSVYFADQIRYLELLIANIKK